MQKLRHLRDEVTIAINKLKARHPQALLSIEAISAVVNMDMLSSDEIEETSQEKRRSDGHRKTKKEKIRREKKST